jgi:hypothetical protein
LRARSRTERLRELTSGLTLPLTSEKRTLLSYTTIEAANLWAQYSQSFFLSVAFGARDVSGNRIVATPAAALEEAIDSAVWALRPKLAGTKRAWQRHELPDWQNKGHLSRAVRAISPRLWPDVDTALSYSTRALSDLPTMRNYYAHKAERAAASARGVGTHYGITRRLSPEELALTQPPGSSDTLLEGWLADLAAILKLMP